TGAVAMGNGLSLMWLFVIAVCGGFAGYEINYWSGRIFGLAICQGICPTVLNNSNVRKALNVMDRFGLAIMVFSRFMPVLNLPSFIAGVNVMKYRRYFGFNLISSILWCGSLLMLGYYIGSISFLSDFLDNLMGLFIVILVVAIIIAIVMFARDYVKRKGSCSLRNKKILGFCCVCGWQPVFHLVKIIKSTTNATAPGRRVMIS